MACRPLCVQQRFCSVVVARGVVFNCAAASHRICAVLIAIGVLLPFALRLAWLVSLFALSGICGLVRDMGEVVGVDGILGCSGVVSIREVSGRCCVGNC